MPILNYSKETLERLAIEAVEYQDSYSTGSSTFSIIPSYEVSNPLNPKTKENIKRSEQLAPKAQRSSTVGKRWTSVQAWSYSSLNYDVDPNFLHTDLIITTNIRPLNGSGWDEVVSVQDFTTYNASAWSGGTAPNSANKMTTVNTGTHIELRYTDQAFNPSAGYYHYPNNNGIITLLLRVTYVSGHIESFTMYAPVGTKYRDFINCSSSLLLDQVQEVHGCGEDTFYSKSQNSLHSNPNPISDYSILTRYKPEDNPSNSLAEVGHYQTFPSGFSNPFHIVHPISQAWGDPLIQDYGNNGVITPDQNQTARQKFYRIDVLAQQVPGITNNTIDGKSPTWFYSNYTAAQSNPDIYHDNALTGPGDATSFDSVIASLTNNNSNQLFTYTAYYAHNIIPCGTTGLKEYFVCDTPGNPSYWQTTFLGSSTQGQCNTLTIPVTDRPGGSNYINCLFTHDPACCTVCTLAVSVTSTDASYGVSDGVLSWDARLLGVATGNPFGSGSMYTVAVTNAAGTVVGTAAPTGTNTFTDATCDTTNNNTFVGCDSSVAIKPGMQVSGTGIPTSSYVGSITTGVVSTNVTQFTLVDSGGLTVLATATNTNTTLTFSTGMYGEHGALAPNDVANPFYKVCVTDKDGCEECATVVINTGHAPLGCTDSTSVNYDSTAIIDDGSCILCDSTDGLLHDPTSGNTTNFFDTLTASGNAATASSSTAHNSDGTLAVSAAPINAILGYLTFDVNSKFELLLYKTVNQGEASTAAGATQIGGTINAGTLNNVTVAAHTFTSLAYGYYTIRVRYVDTNTVSTTENCWTEWYGLVQAEVCDDVNNSTYNANPTDPVLRLSNSSLCTQVIPCCVLDPIIEDLYTNTTACNAVLYSRVDCDPYRTVIVEWFYSPTGTGYTSIGSYNLGFVTAPVYLYCNDSNNTSMTNWVATNGTGFYKVIMEGTYTGNHGSTDICIEEEIYFHTAPLSGCMDQAAHNYDPAAICPGPCAFPSWDCDPITGYCYDPWTGTFPYTPGSYNCETGAGCCNNYCVPLPVYGCTDPCATNFDPAATADDGSCTYTACLDPNATNQYQNCCNNNYYSSSQIIGADNSCCIDRCLPQNTISITSTDSTSTCTVFNNDGTVNVAVVINNAAQTWTWKIWDNSMTTVIYSDITGGNGFGVYSGSGTSDTYSLLGTGNYNIVVIDNLGCEWSLAFSIGSNSPLVGCTNPDATNYDPAAVCDCGCCFICGCLDPNASNYNPNANVSCQCEYEDPPPSPCLPATLHEDIEKIRACLTLKGSEWLKDYKIARADDCTLMNKWKLILIEYLLSQENEGLDCLFNCADIQTPAPSPQDCNALWVTGGASTGLNHDPNHLFASIVNVGEGTTVTAYDGYPLGWYGKDVSLTPSSNFTFVGDVIKWDLPSGHPLASSLNGTVWTLTKHFGQPGGPHFGCSNGKIGHYTQCLDFNSITITTTVNYYDNFLNFVNKFCADCNISILNNK